jgi:hypothetical protein
MLATVVLVAALIIEELFVALAVRLFGPYEVKRDQF